ncbi:hypothetical protein [Anoxybacillus sp. PDR2]|nr:hypothetical protein [Anoxybacillus sp. PDR2]QHC04143.1 hypothetical protein GRQ40_09335 [Anoxybacillus sp. PDR2]
MLIAEVIEELLHLGIIPPVFVSGNVEGGFEYNQSYIQQYRSRIRHL